jgi:hypothetical protein
MKSVLVATQKMYPYGTIIKTTDIEGYYEKVEYDETKSGSFDDAISKKIKGTLDRGYIPVGYIIR